MGKKEHNTGWNQAKLSRVQLFGTLAIVFMLACTLSGYFLWQTWRDFEARQRGIGQESSARAREYLKAYADHAALTLTALRDRSHDTLKQQLQEHVDQAWRIADTLWRTQHARLGDAATRKLIAETLRPLRYFDGRGYYFIDTLRGDCVLLPIEPRREGSPLWALQDDSGNYVMRKLIHAQDNADQRGFAAYRWYLPGNREMADKVAYVRRFEPYGWLIGSGEYLGNIEAMLQKRGLDILSRLPGEESGDDLMILDAMGMVLLYPSNPALQGKSYRALPPNERGRAEALLRLGRQGGFLEYGNHDGERSRLAYARFLPGWNWTLVTSLRLQAMDSDGRAAARELHQSLAERVAALVGMTLVALLVAGLFSWSFVRWLNTLLRRYQSDLEISHQALSARARELRLSQFMVDNATDLVALRNAAGELVYYNEAVSKLVDCPHGDLQQLAERLFTLPPGMLPLTFETRHRCGEHATALEVTVNELHYHGERYLCATARDISARRQTERQLQLAAKVFEASNEAILITDPENRILATNRAFCQITGFSEAEVLGQTPALLASGRHDAAFYQDMWQSLHAHGQWSGEIWNRRKNGEPFPEWLNISVLLDERGEISHYLALFTDISERKEQEARVRHMAEYDALTDLPNRVLVNDRLHQAIRQAEARHGQLAVLFVDLDHFKNINDTLGHASGDDLLKQVARRLATAVREQDTVGRTGGDEFVLILPAIGQPAEAAQVAERILRSMQAPFTLAGQQLGVSCSIGISLMPDDGHDIQNLLMNADLAMYHAKAHGRNTFRFYTREMNALVTERLQMENRLRRALENEELFLVYQPQYDMAGARLIGCEALARWKSPDEGLVMPARFIPVAEDTGLIVPLGSWVLNEACRQAAVWLAEGRSPVRVAVNVSTRQLTRPEFLAEVREALQKHALPGHCLEIEVTESTLMEDADLAARQFAVLKAMGVRLAVDDFGTGYSSLAYLKRFAPDTVKIDRSFVIDLPHDEENAAIVSAIIQLAGALGMRTLAEGVENESQRHYLGRLGCAAMQGYLRGAPLAADKMQMLMSQDDATVA